MGDGSVRLVEARQVPALLLSEPTCWSRLVMSEGTKGPRSYQWACISLLHRGQEDGWHSLLIRCPEDPQVDPTFYLVFAPPATSLQAKVDALGARWRIEEDFEQSKDLGLDHYEVRSFVGWYRHITLVMLALAFLVSLTSQQPRAADLTSLPLYPLSVSEVRHLLAHVFFPAPSSTQLVVAWSTWRRRHQRGSCLFHTRHRLKAG